MLYADTGTLQSWRPAPNGPVDVILVQNGMLIVGGEFTMIAGQPRNYIAVFDAATGALLPTAPVTTQMVTALYADGNNIYFNCFSSGGFQIKYFDLSTGAVSSWGSDTFAAYDAVNAIVKVGNYIYAGGSFTANYSYLNISNLARYSVATGHLDTSFVMGSAQTDWVSQILSYNGNIYVCGSFDSLGNYPAYGFLALDSTGVPTNFNFYPSSDQTLCMFPQGNTLWVGGYSNSLGGSSNSRYLAQILLPIGVATCWEHPIYENWVTTEAIYVSNDTVWAGAIDANNNFNMYVGNPYSVSHTNITISTVNGFPIAGLDSFSATYIPNASYQWYINGNPIYYNYGLGSPAIGLHGDYNGDSIWVVVSVNSCNNLVTSYDTSNIIYISMPPPPPPPPLPPSAQIYNFNMNMCQGENDVTIWAEIYNRIGSQIHYQWYRNGIPVGTDSSLYTPVNLQNGDSIWVVAIDSGYIAVSDTMTISTFQMPSLSLSVSGNCNSSDTINLSGYSTSFPIYWMRNNSVIDTVTINQLICPFPQSAYNLGEVTDMAVDRYGAVYISGDSNRVIKWAPGDSMGVVVAGDPSGIAGNGPAYLNSPSGIFVDSNRNLYICDVLNNRVQRWNYGATQGVTVAGGNGAGSAANQLDWPDKIYVDNAANVYITDYFNYRVQKWPQGATTGITVAGGNGPDNGIQNNSQLSQLGGLAVDNFGNVYVGDIYWGCIYRWSPGDTVGTLITGNNVNYTGGYFIKFDNHGNLLIADNGFLSSSGPPCSIVSWNVADSTSKTLISGYTEFFQPALSAPLDAYMDASGCIYVLESTLNLNVSGYPNQGWVTKWCGVDTSFITNQPGSYRAVMTYTNGCIDTSGAVTISTGTVTATSTQICRGSSYLFNGHILTQAGTYIDTFISGAGCDSIVTLHLSVTNPAPSTISRSGSILTDNTSAQHYQWLLNGIDIPGDTSVSITITQNGYYNAVLTDANGCIQSSDTLHIINAGIAGISPLETVYIHPNPAIESCTISISGTGADSYNAVLTDMTGKMVADLGDFKAPAFTFSVSQYSKGVYLLRISDQHGDSSVNKLIVE
jgi:hypothetical protein